MIQLDVPNEFEPLIRQAQQVAQSVFLPISRKYDRLEHEEPKELRVLGAILRGLSNPDASAGPRPKGLLKSRSGTPDAANANGRNLANVLAMIELCAGDLGLALSIPGLGLGNAAIAAVGTPEQQARFADKWACMAISEPNAGSDSAAIRTSARLDGDHYVLNGEKIFVTAGERSELVVVWATLDATLGRAAIKSFVVEKGTAGMRVTRLEKKLGIRASDTATIMFEDCRVSKDSLLGSAQIDPRKSFAGAMQTFDDTRPLVAAMSVGVARAALERTRELLEREGVVPTYGGSLYAQGAASAELLLLEAELEAAYLLTLRAAWLADNAQPNSVEASMAKAKAARVAGVITLRCVELCGAIGYGEGELLEKWARDSKILDIFEGTQQIQLLIIARRLLELTSSELR